MISAIKKPNESIQIGVPASLGITRKKYLPAVRGLYNSNAYGLFTKLTPDQFSKGVLRLIPFFNWFDEKLQYRPETLQLATHPKDGIVGFFGSPREVPTNIAQFLIKNGMKSNKLNLDPKLAAALNDPNTKVFLNTALCVDKNHRQQGIAKAMKLASEQCLQNKYGSLANNLHKAHEKQTTPKIVLLTAHEKDNSASSKTQDSLGYTRLFEYKYPWPLSLNFVIRAKILETGNSIKNVTIATNSAKEVKVNSQVTSSTAA